MAIDTRNKRASALALLLPFIVSAPLADGALEQPDLQHALGAYAGVTATQASPYSNPSRLARAGGIQLVAAGGVQMVPAGGTRLVRLS